MRDTTYSIVFKNFKGFSDKIGGEIRTSKKSDIDSGGARKYLTFEVEKEIENNKYTFSQTFIYGFSDPENLIVTTRLNCTIKKSTKLDFYLHFWTKGFFERLFKVHMISSGNLVFDRMFSAKSSNKELTNSIFKNIDIQDFFLSNQFLVFNINTNDNEMTVKLKDMNLKVYSLDLIETTFENLKKLNRLIVV